MAAVVSVQKLKYSYDHKPLIEDLSFDLPPATCLWVQGPNGSGKTTLLKIIGGFLNAYEGEVQRPEAFHFVFSKPVLAPHTKILSYLGLCTHLTKKREIKTVIEAAEIIGLKDEIQGDFCALSDGQKQRLMWLPLLLEKRSLWILDEPLNHLDNTSIKIFETLLDSHREHGGAAIFSSHRHFSTNTHILDLGRLHR